MNRPGARNDPRAGRGPLVLLPGGGTKATLPRNTVLVGDALAQLRTLPDASVDCVVTSPPYYGLRDYDVPGQIGLESSVHEWVARLVPVFAEVARVLKPTGSLWLNLGDSYSRHASYGAPPKGKLLAPERLLLALVGDGWICRNKVVWAKSNAMPSSVGDRLNASYEVVYFLVRSRHYFFDLDAIREPHRSRSARKKGAATKTMAAWAGPLAAGSQDGLRRARPADQPGHLLGRNPGDVWTIATCGVPGGHHATFPKELVRRPLLSTCPEAVCTQCGQPWRRRMTVRTLGTVKPVPKERHVRPSPTRWLTLREPGSLVPCGCGAPTQPGVVLDPFFGTGTVGVAAQEHGGDWIGIELNEKYVALARERLRGRFVREGRSHRRYDRAASPGAASATETGRYERRTKKDLGAHWCPLCRRRGCRRPRQDRWQRGSSNQLRVATGRDRRSRTCPPRLRTLATASSDGHLRTNGTDFCHRPRNGDNREPGRQDVKVRWRNSSHQGRGLSPW